MKYTAEIIIKEDIENVHKTLLPELNEGKRDRSDFNVHKTKEILKIEVNAADAVALRATLNNITKLLEVYEKIK